MANNPQFHLLQVKFVGFVLHTSTVKNGIKWRRKTYENKRINKIRKDPLQIISTQHMSALFYACQGFKVLPIWPNSKKPMTCDGHKAATTDCGQINKWWKKCPKANIAIRTDGLLVLDIDTKAGIDGYQAIKDLESKYGKLPITRTQTTPSGGKHLIFRTTSFIPSFIGCPAPGLDIRAYDGYILVDGSSIDRKSYSMDQAAIVVAPQWLVDLIMSQQTNQGSNDFSDQYMDQSVTETFIKISNFDEVININGMGQSLKVKYDSVTNQLVVV